MSANEWLKGKVAVVTGGGTGIGRVIASELAARGADIVLAARQKERLEAAAAELRASRRRCLAVATDVSRPEQVASLFERVDEEFGGVDILVNNAAANFIRPTQALTPVRWLKVIDIVLNGTFYCSLEAGKRMLRRKAGAIVNIVASYAWAGGPGLAPSASAKAGVVALTRTLGAEWAAQGLRVNAVCPGFVDTPQARQRLWPQEWMRRDILSRIPCGRFGTEEEIAGAVLYLCSPPASYVNGEVLVVDGGESLGKGALGLIGKAGITRRPGKRTPSP